MNNPNTWARACTGEFNVYTSTKALIKEEEEKNKETHGSFPVDCREIFISST
jgi:hypothetical protein